MKDIPLKHIVDINRQALSESTPSDYELRYIDIGAVGHGSLIEEPSVVTFDDAPSRARRVVQEGDTLVSTVRTYLRAVWTVREPVQDLIASTGFAVLTPRAGVDPRHLGWLVQSDAVIDEVVARSVGVSYPAINAADIGDIRVPLPSLPQQRAIADFLDAETARIDALLAKKQQLAAALYARLRAHAAALTKAPAVARLNAGDAKVPEGWRLMRIRRCIAAMDYGIGEASSPSGLIPVLGMGNVDDRGGVGGIPAGYVDTVTPELLLRPDDLLFNRTNSLAKVGKVGLVAELAGPTTFASYLVRFRVARFVCARYINYLLNSDQFLELARSTALPSIGQANLNPSRYSELYVAIPSLHEQRRSADRLDEEFSNVASLWEWLAQQVSLLRERRQALITAAVTGEMEVPGVAA